jgi:hypothetical protein
MGAVAGLASAILAKADAEKRDLTDVESAEIEKLCDEFDQLEARGDDDALYFARLKLRLASGRRLR